MLYNLARWLYDAASGGVPLGEVPTLQWLHATLNCALGLACFTIPIALLVVRHQRNIIFSRQFGLLTAVVLLCGIGYWINLLSLWMAAQGSGGLAPASVAIAALCIAGAGLWVIPRALILLSQNDLQRANEVVFRLTQAECRLVAAVAEASSVRDDLAREMAWRETAEKDGHESEARYRLLAENSSDMITLMPTFGTRRMYVSPASRVIVGYDPEELMSLHADIEVHPDDLPRVISERVSLTPKAPRVTSEYRIRHKAGHWVWVEAVVLLANPGAPEQSVVITARDVTERRRLESEQALYKRQLERSNAELERLAVHLEHARDQAERESRAKSRFLAGMSHELRTPLNGILGYAQLLHLEGGLNEVQSARVAAMLGAGAHLLQMINCVLDLSEIETERVELNVSEIDLHRVAAACLDLVLPTAEAKQFWLNLVIAPDVPNLVLTDPARLRQVLLNLLGNAVKFITTGGVELRLSTAAGATRLRFEVADTGPGIPIEQRDRLFQEFERLDTNPPGTVEGAGLGLFLSAQLATLMGGQLGHADNPGGGSVFWLELPLVVTGDPPALAAEPPPPPLAICVPAEETQAAALRVLIVDDVAMNRDIASAFILASGHSVVCAEGGAKAVLLAGASDFDVVLMDVRMPVMDGLEATRHIRAIAGPRGRVPIVAMTAQAFTEQVEACRAVGMDGHLAKPFTLATLLEALTSGAAAGQRRNAESTAPRGKNAGKEANAARVAPAALLGAELPILDLVAFGETAALLKPDMVVRHLRTLAEKGATLLRDLRATNDVARTGMTLAEAAHALAGSAGMFGLERLASLSRQFERAIQTSDPAMSRIVDALRATLEATIEEIDMRTTVAA